MSDKHAGGRPTKYTPEYLAEINKNLEKYIEANNIPIIAEFAYLNKIPRQKLYEFEELNDTIKRCIDKKEANLEKMALENKINHTMAIFSLKQMGWKDSKSIEHSGSIETTDITGVISEIKKALKK